MSELARKINEWKRRRWTQRMRTLETLKCFWTPGCSVWSHRVWTLTSWVQNASARLARMNAGLVCYGKHTSLSSIENYYTIFHAFIKCIYWQNVEWSLCHEQNEDVLSSNVHNMHLGNCAYGFLGNSWMPSHCSVCYAWQWSVCWYSTTACIRTTNVGSVLALMCRFLHRFLCTVYIAFESSYSRCTTAVTERSMRAFMHANVMIHRPKYRALAWNRRTRLLRFMHVHLTWKNS